MFSTEMFFTNQLDMLRRLGRAAEPTIEHFVRGRAAIIAELEKVWAAYDYGPPDLLSIQGIHLGMPVVPFGWVPAREQIALTRLNCVLVANEVDEVNVAPYYLYDVHEARLTDDARLGLTMPEVVALAVHTDALLRQRALAATRRSATYLPTLTVVAAQVATCRLPLATPDFAPTCAARSIAL